MTARVRRAALIELYSAGIRDVLSKPAIVWETNIISE